MRDPEASDSRELLRRMRSGDGDAANRLFAKYAVRLRRWAHGRLPHWARGAFDTADLVQDTFLNVYQHLNRFEPRRNGALLGYLRRALRNRLIDHLRQTRTRPTPTALDDLPSWTDSPLDAAAKSQERERYFMALQMLRPSDRQAIVARLELGYSYEQLALVLHKATPLAARVAVRRALLRLAHELRNAR